ncbi:MAG: MFS transporter [Chloroflexota bacterium]
MGTGAQLGEVPVGARQDWRTRLPFFYGWFIVGASFVALGLTYSVWYSFSVFYVALLEEFGWSRGASAGVFSLFVVVVGIGGAAAGALCDRFGPRRVVAIGTVILVLGMIACSQITELWQFYLVFGVVCAVGVSSSGWVPCVTTVSNWFSHRLGMALGVASAGIGIGILVMVPFTQLLINWFGWRTAYLVLAAVILVGVMPVALLVLRGRPEELGLKRDGRKSVEQSPQEGGKPPARPSRVVDREWAGRDWSVATAMRTRRYWLLAAMLVLNNVATQMIFVHQVAFLVDGGYDRLLAASVVGLIGFFSVGTKIGWGWVSDRLSREVTYTMGLSAMLVAVSALIGTQVVSFGPIVYVFALAFALAYGVATPIGPAVGADLFMGRRFGSVYGTLGVANGLGSAIGAWFAGYVFDATGGYLFAFGCAAGSSLLSIMAMWLVAPRKIRVVPGKAT